MGVNCMSVRAMPRVGCQCPACPRAVQGAQPLVLPPLAVETENVPAKDKKGSKMKVLKKIKKKMGLAAPRPCAGTPNNLPPLVFHRVHGDNVRLSRDGSLARRVESFCKGVAFSARPVRVNEKVCLRFAEISNNWSGVLRFGFTSNDPTMLAHCLPKYACPDLTNKPGYWAKALAERFCEKDNVLFYYFTASGDVHFGINGEEKGIFFSGVETRGALWALLDIYGNCTGVQFCDPRATRRSLTSAASSEVDLSTSMRSLNIDEQLPPPRFQQAVTPLMLHRVRGRNIRTITDRGVAARVETEFCQGYVFTARPMRPGETIVVQILSTESAYAGSLAIGLTSCDPANLRPSELPDDAESLLDRPEYWVVRRDAANGMRRGDEMAVTLTVDGEVRVSRNGSAPLTVMHVDHTLRLWAFVDVYGATQKVRLLGTTVPASTPPPAQLRVQLANGTALPSGGGAVLVVSLPPPAASVTQPGLTLASAHYIEPIANQLCLSNIPQWPQDGQCASASQNNANNQQLDLPPAQTCVPPVTCADRINNQHYNHLHSQIVAHANHGQIASPIAHSSQISLHSQNLPLSSQIAPHNSQISLHSQNSAHSNQNASHSSQIAPISSQMASISSQITPHSSQIATHSSQIAPHSSQIAPHSSQIHNQIVHNAHSNPSMYSVMGDFPSHSAAGTDCTICYENPIDSVLYMCGHMCMCYRCAVQQWRGKGGGQCPLCRAHIKDVIRTYKS